MKTILHFIALLAAISLASCNNRQCINPKNKVLGKSTEQLLGHAKNRSWWVYAKENSTLRDSIHLENFSDKILRLRENEACDDKEVISFDLIGQGILCHKVKATIEALASIDVATYADSIDNKLFNFIFYKEKSDKYAENEWLKYEILPTFWVLGTEYQDVLKVYQKGFDLNGVADAEQKQIRYFAPKIGLIRVENVADAH